MAYLKSAVQISINTDNTFTMFIDKSYMDKDDTKKDSCCSYDGDNNLVFSASNLDELVEKMKVYLPQLKYTDEKEIFKNTFNSINAKMAK